MSRRLFALVAITISVLLGSCGKDIPELTGVDTSSWKSDRNGCNGKRAPMKQAIVEQKEKLLALDEVQIVKLLGNPDRNELFKRNQKFYYYFLEPAPECASPAPSPSKLIVRFNAMGLAKEVEVK